MMKYVNMEHFGYIIFEKHIKHEDIINRLRGDMDIEVKSQGFISSFHLDPLCAYEKPSTLSNDSNLIDTYNICKIIDKD